MIFTIQIRPFQYIIKQDFIVNAHQITIFNKPITVHNYIVYSNKMFYGWKIVISVVLVLTVTGPTDVSTANIYQKAVNEALNISSSQCSNSSTLVLGISVLLSPWISGLLAKNFKQVFLIVSIIYGLVYIAFSVSITQDNLV